MVIAAALLIGGVAMAVIEWLPLNVTTRRIERVTWKQALGIGAAQVLAAVFPGTSRSAATIMAGLVGGLSRPAAAEFSFFLAIPAMGAACTYKLLKFLHQGVPPASQILLLIIGTLVSFLVAWAVIALFMGYIRRHSFLPFAIYRIALGVVVLLLFKGGPAGH
jgi:undecaprenyl-diphosphatase